MTEFRKTRPHDDINAAAFMRVAEISVLGTSLRISSVYPVVQKRESKAESSIFHLMRFMASALVGDLGHLSRINPIVSERIFSRLRNFRREKRRMYTSSRLYGAL